MIAVTATQASTTVFAALMTMAAIHYGEEGGGDCSGLIQGALLGTMEFCFQSTDAPELLEGRLRSMFDILLPQVAMARRQRDLGSATEAGHA